MNTKRNLFNAIKDYAFIFVSILLYGFAWQGLIFSHKITTGGLAGISSVISWAFEIPASYPYNIINVGLVILALFILGWRFSLKTVYSVAVLALTIPFYESFFAKHGPLLADQPVLAVVLGAILCGLSLGMVFSVNGSTGGTDIVAAIINKYRNVTIGRALMLIDFVILGVSYYLFRDADKIILSLVEVIVVNLTVDYYLNGYRQSVQFFINTKKHKEVADTIMSELNRGCTFIEAEGAFTGEKQKLVMVIAKKSESTMIFRAIKSVDPEAFISQSLVRGAYGRGFEPLQSIKDK
ncbi:YitT family protein [Porphyromonas sp.]|uniref:YitT family protein n=1 Tax=Porphyromonas sp. TaxID=1924944 RepID=UPI0026DA8CAA|nr:YitT family protein [Porphyromonas sp.]MDO4771482.1 YitT family protein [Porphyromonas sp.]